MTTDLTMLAYSAIFCVLLAFPYTLGMIAADGLAKAAGNREGMGEAPGWRGRARRAHLNMVENLVPFAALVLVVHLAQKASPMTAHGAELFFYARVAHAVVYILGVPYLRTLAWFASLAGIAMVAGALFA